LLGKNHRGIPLESQCKSKRLSLQRGYYLIPLIGQLFLRIKVSIISDTSLGLSSIKKWPAWGIICSDEPGIMHLMYLALSKIYNNFRYKNDITTSYKLNIPQI
jgi:hypothetical protein